MYFFELKENQRIVYRSVDFLEFNFIAHEHSVITLNWPNWLSILISLSNDSQWTMLISQEGFLLPSEIYWKTITVLIVLFLYLQQFQAQDSGFELLSDEWIVHFQIIQRTSDIWYIVSNSENLCFWSKLLIIFFCKNILNFTWEQVELAWLEKFWLPEKFLAVKKLGTEEKICRLFLNFQIFLR